MRTTLDIDQDVLEATKEIASRTRRTSGQILSDLARRALIASSPSPGTAPSLVNGFEILPAAGRVITTDLVRKLSEESEER